MSVKIMKPAPTWVVRDGYEWAIISINDDTGHVAISSSYGEFSYVWRAIGNKTLLEFVCGLNFDYAMGKFLGMETHLNFEKTIQNIKRQLLDFRLDRSLSKETARELWEEVDEMEKTENPDHFAELFYATAFADFNEYWHDAMDMDHKPGARAFWDTLWAEFVREVRA